jgi:Fe-S cluster assembly protein SufB
MPLQAYFRINTNNMGQFERTLIIVDEGASVHYVEGCTAPTYSSDSLHSAVVEIIVKRGGRARYTTIQNWSNNVYNLVTKRAVAYQDAVMEWVDCNIGSKLTMKYPAIYLVEPGAHGEVLSVAFAGKGQHQDAGAKIVHAAPRTTSQIISKSISMHGGRSSYRGLLKVNAGAVGSKSNVVCDALLMDEQSRTDTYPSIESGCARVGWRRGSCIRGCRCRISRMRHGGGRITARSAGKRRGGLCPMRLAQLRACRQRTASR